MTTDERKAAESFQNMLKALVEAEQKALSEHSPNENGQDNYDRDSAEAFIEQLKASFFLWVYSQDISFKIIKVVIQVTVP